MPTHTVSSTISHPLLFLVLIISVFFPLSDALVKPSSPVAHSPPSFFTFLRNHFLYFAQHQVAPVGKNRLSNRPLPAPVPAAPYLVLNVSWPGPSKTTSSISGTSLRRAEFDTAITFADDPLRHVFGTGCNGTFSQPSSAVLFSGDDVYAPGWEGYRFALPGFFDLGPPDEKRNGSSVSTLALLLNHFMYGRTAILIYAIREPTFQSEFYVNATMYDVNGTVVSTRSLTLDVTPLFPGICETYFNSKDGPIAMLQLDPSANRLILSEPESEPAPNESAEPLEPSPGVIIETNNTNTNSSTIPVQSSPQPSPTTQQFPPMLRNSYSLFINTSWTTSEADIAAYPNRTYWDLESGLQLPGISTTFSVCDVSSNGVLYSSRNDPSPTGYEAFHVDLDSLLSSLPGVAEDQFVKLTFTAFADWYIEENRNGDATITATLLEPFGIAMIGPGSTATVDEIVPGVTRSCTPSKPVVEIIVQYNRFNGLYRIMSMTAEELGPDVSTQPDPESGTASTGTPTPEPATPNTSSPLPSTSPPSNTYTEPLGELRMVITYSWPDTETDLDTQVRLGSLVHGIGCFADSSGTVVFLGDSTEAGGNETYYVRIGKASMDGFWVNVVDVTLSASWYSRPEYKGGTATVTVELLNENDEIVKRVQREFNPFRANRNHGLTCAKNKIGTVRVVDVNGTVSMDVGIY